MAKLKMKCIELLAPLEQSKEIIDCLQRMGSASGSSTHYFCFCCTVPSPFRPLNGTSRRRRARRKRLTNMLRRKRD